MKEIVISGCSFSATSDEVYPKKENEYDCWGEILDNKLNYKVTNLSRGGSGNFSICKRAQDYIVKNHNKIEFCIIGLSEWTRIEDSILDRSTWADHMLLDRESKWHEKYIYAHEKLVFSTLRSVYELQDICDRYKIKCVFFQFLHPIFKHINPEKFFKVINPTYEKDKETLSEADKEKIKFVWKRTQTDILKSIISNPYFDLIDDSYIIGWPFFDKLGGYNFNEKYFKPDPNKYLLKDSHPNQEGHKLISSIIQEELKKFKLI